MRCSRSWEVSAAVNPWGAEPWCSWDPPELPHTGKGPYSTASRALPQKMTPRRWEQGARQGLSACPSVSPCPEHPRCWAVGWCLLPLSPVPPTFTRVPCGPILALARMAAGTAALHRQLSGLAEPACVWALPGNNYKHTAPKHLGHKV